MRYKKQQRVFTYKCTMTEEEFVTTAEAPNAGELVSIKAYYDMHPEEDDRPEAVKKKIAAQSNG